MTEQEAIEWIKAVRATDAKSSNQVGLLQRKEAFNLAIEALEKQIPKKPIIITNKSHSNLKTFECPVCGNVFVKNGYYPNELYSGHGLYSHKYCEKCGQLIEWRVKE